MKQLDIKLPETLFGIETALVKIFIIPFLLILFFIFSLNLIILPKISDINLVNDQIKQVIDKTQVVTEKKNYLMSRDQEKLKTEEAYLKSAILREDQSYYLVGVVRFIADKYGFQIKSFSISPGKLKDDDTIKIADKEVMNRLPISVVLVGPKERHLDLLIEMEKSLPILMINKFDINTSGTVAELNLDINSFYITKNPVSDVTTLSLNDLTLNKEESDLLDRLGQFTKVNVDSNTNTQQNSGSGKFVQYQRSNPFSL